jgi:hypothetical protein
LDLKGNVGQEGYLYGSCTSHASAYAMWNHVCIRSAALWKLRSYTSISADEVVSLPAPDRSFRTRLVKWITVIYCLPLSSMCSTWFRVNVYYVPGEQKYQGLRKVWLSQWVSVFQMQRSSLRSAHWLHQEWGDRWSRFRLMRK